MILLREQIITYPASLKLTTYVAAESDQTDFNVYLNLMEIKELFKEALELLTPYPIIEITGVKHAHYIGDMYNNYNVVKHGIAIEDFTKFMWTLIEDPHCHSLYKAIALQYLKPLSEDGIIEYVYQKLKLNCL